MTRSDPERGNAASDRRAGHSTLRTTILDLIGDTPLVDGIWVKLEYRNPSGSIKARLAKYMIEGGAREGLPHPGDTIVEASSGNTGNAMSMVAAVKGHRMLVAMSDGMSPERLAISRAFGAEVRLVGTFHVNDALAVALDIGFLPGSSVPSNSIRNGMLTRIEHGSERRSSSRCRQTSFPTPLWRGSGPAAH